MAQFHFLGTGNAFGQGGRLPSCHLITSKSANILLDCGPSILPALYGNNFSPGQIDFIVITHLHADHMGGLPFFLLDDKWITKRDDPLKVICPRGTKDLIQGLCELYYSQEEVMHMSNVFEFIPFDVKETVQLGNISVTGIEALHSAEARMIIVEVDGKKIGYSGDTGLHLQSLNILIGCDLVVHECTSFEHLIPNHVNYSQLAEAVSSEFTLESNKRIYLTHVDDTMVKNAEKIQSPFVLAHDGMQVKI